jgi:hypothetical protein
MQELRYGDACMSVCDMCTMQSNQAGKRRKRGAEIIGVVIAALAGCAKIKGRIDVQLRPCLQLPVILSLRCGETDVLHHFEGDRFDGSHQSVFLPPAADALDEAGWRPAGAGMRSGKTCHCHGISFRVSWLDCHDANMGFSYA